MRWGSREFPSNSMAYHPVMTRLLLATLLLLTDAATTGGRRRSRRSSRREEALSVHNYNFEADPQVAGNASPSFVAVDPHKTFGAWEGWGVSLCWWASAFGDREDLADAIFSFEDSVTITSAAEGPFVVPGLGLNIARYNAGGSSFAPAGEGEFMVVSPNIEPSRQVMGFWRDGASADPSSPSWNWTVDAKQVAM